MPDKAEVGRLIKALHAELASSDPATARETRRLCERMSGRAAEPLGLFIYGLQAAATAPVNSASITVLKAAGVVGYEAGIRGLPPPLRPRSSRVAARGMAATDGARGPAREMAS